MTKKLNIVSKLLKKSIIEILASYDFPFRERTHLILTIPKIEDLENLLCGLLIYQYTHVERLTEEEAFNSLSARNVDLKAVRECYYRLSELLQDYDLISRAK